MPRFAPSVVDRIAKDDARLGEHWLKAINPPFAEESAHRALLDNDQEFIKDAKRTFGHRLDSRSTIKRFPEARMKLDEWKTLHSPDFHKWNVDMTAGAGRLQVLDGDRVGAVLCVARNGNNGQPFITVVAGPVITPVDVEANVAYQGAPDWGLTFHNELVDEYLPEGMDFTHGVVASVAQATRVMVPDSIDELVDSVQPVMMTPDNRFKNRVTVDSRAPEEEQPFKTLFLPLYCDPVVGLWLPTDIGYKGFLDLIQGQRPYGTFAALLKDHKETFQAWFEAANEWPELMVVNMTDARPLWNTFPCSTNTELATRAGERHLGPFLFQAWKFLWQFYCDAILCGSSRNSADEEARADFLRYLQVVETKLGSSDDRTTLPAMVYPFVPYLYRMSQDPVVTAWLQPFLKPDEPLLQLPSEVRAIRPTDLRPMEPAVPDDSDGEGESDASTPMRRPPSRSARSSSRVDRRILTPLSPVASPARVHNSPPRRSHQHTPDSDRHSQWVTDERRRSHNHSNHVTQSPATSDTTPRRSPRLRAAARQRNRDVRSPSIDPSLSGSEDRYQGTRREQLRSTKRHLDYGRGGHDDSSPARQRRRVETPPRRHYRDASSDEATPYSSSDDDTPPRRGHSTRYRPSRCHDDSPARTRKRQRAPDRPVVARSYVRPRRSRRADTWSPSPERAHVRPRSKAKDDMSKASIYTRSTLTTCPIQLIHASLFLLDPVDSGLEIRTHRRQSERKSKDYVFVTEPSQWAKDNVLAIYDKGSTVTATAIASMVVHRCNSGDDFGNGVSMLPGDIVGLTDVFIKRLFDVNQWQIRSGVPIRHTDRFHVLEFQRLLDQDKPEKHLPEGGYDLEFAQQLGKVIYNLLSLVGVRERGSRGRLEDTPFRNSPFGKLLLRLCQAPFNRGLAKLWEKHQLQISNLWMNDFVALFEAQANFVQTRTGAGAVHSFEMMDVRDDDDGPFICASVIMNTGFGHRQDNFLNTVQQMKRVCELRWDLCRYTGGETMWTEPVPAGLLPPKVHSSNTTKRQERDKDRDPDDRKQKHDPKPFTAIKPLFVFKKTCPEGQTPQEMLRDSGEVKNGWPRMRPLRGKGTRQVCFCCAFVSSKICKDMRECKPGGNKNWGKGQQRLHIDLNDRKWKEKTTPSHWTQLVDFQNDMYQWFEPTEDLKALLPAAKWKLE